MKAFFVNVLRYGQFLIGIVLGIAAFAVQPLLPLLRRPVTAVPLVVAIASAFVGVVLVLRAMLGLDAV